MSTRNGKIAQLPNSIRHELNHRLENGQQGPDLLQWLNSLPETQKLIAEKFDNQPITRSNLSDWRQGGFKEWQVDQLREARIKRVCETGGSLKKAETGDLFENFARMAIAEMVTDLDALQKLHGEKRLEQMRNLVRDLARLQNAYNRSRWADLAWNKYNDTLPLANPSDPQTANSQLPTPILTPSSTPVVPDRAESQAAPPDEGEPKPNATGQFVLHFTNCNCNEPCPKCHAPDSDYPHEDAVRDHRYYRKHFRYPHDRHGRERFLINVTCDCHCDRCTGKINGSATLPCCPITHHAESCDETSSAQIHPTPLLNPEAIVSPISPGKPIALDPRSDFLRKMSHLKSMAQ